jgi:hypothetical protein
MASGLVIARARASLRRRLERNLQVQDAAAGAVPLFPDCYLQ